MHVRRPSITDRKIRFALVGCGRIAGNHFEALKAHADRCELVDVCDVDPQAVWEWGFIERVSTGLAGLRDFDGDDSAVFLEVARRSR